MKLVKSGTILCAAIGLSACDMSTQVNDAWSSAEAALKTNQSVQVISMNPGVNGRDIDPSLTTLAVNMIMPTPPLLSSFDGLVRVRSGNRFLNVDQVSLDSNGTTLLIHLAEALAPRSTYTVMISKKLEDSGKHSMKANFAGTFITGVSVATSAPGPVSDPSAFASASATTATLGGPDACLHINAPDDANPNAAPFSSTDCAGQTPLAKLFVHPNGADNAAGTFDAPLRTLTAARDRAASLMAANPQGVAVFLRGDCDGGCSYQALDPVVIEPMSAPLLIKSILGPVHLSGGMNFSEGQGGTWSDATINVASAGDDGVSGTAAVKKFTFDDASRQIVQVRRGLGANNGKFLVTQLFRNGERLRRSSLTDIRMPMRHYGIRGDQRLVAASVIIPHPEHVDVTSGETELSYDWKWQHARGQITSWTPNKKGFSALSNIDPNSVLFKMDSLTAKARAMVENNLAFVDTPGEWYLDEDSNPMALYYRPKVGEDVKAGQFTMPISQQIFKIRGRSNTDAVHDFYIEGGTDGGMFVEYTNWKYQNHTNEKSYGGLQQAFPADGALDANYIERAAVMGVTFQHYGSHGIRFGASRNYYDMNYDMSYAQNVTFFNNVFFDGGGSGIVLDSYKNLAANGRIKANRFQDTGRVLADSDAISVQNVSRSWVGFNKISGNSYTGIGVGDRCPLSLDDRQDVYSNTIDDTMRVLDDGGGIYLHTGFGVVRDNVISNTAINVVANGYQHKNLWDLYFDEMAFFWRAINNTIPRTSLIKSHSIVYTGNKGVKSPKYLDSASGDDALTQCSADLRHSPSWWTSGQ